uniref:Uncharacterized protein n=1 Tax=Oreochromis aureus TaxID=47969 RepID=A0AAZ1XCP5_OREAU
MLHHYHWWKKSQITYLEVVRLHMELLRVYKAHIFQTTHHSPSVLGYFGVSHNGSTGGQVAKDLEVSLKPGIHNQKPEIKSRNFTFSFISIALSCFLWQINKNKTKTKKILLSCIFSSFAEISLRSRNFGPFWRTLLIGR